MVDAKKELINAYNNKCGIGCFNICNLETFQAVLNASKSANKPVFMATSNRTIDYMGLDNIINLKQGLKRSKVILHLDHGSYKNAVACINAGYDSVMFDGSKESLKRNVNQTKKVVKLGHKYNVLVEGEVGILEKDGLTNAEEARVFAEQTGVDMLAVSVGNQHGYYKYLPNIDLKRLTDIHGLIKTPLVLHGASGLSDAVIKNTLKYGVAKVNVDTDLRWVFTYAVRDFLRKHSMSELNVKSFDIRNYLGLGRDAVEKKVTEKIKLLG